MRDILTQGERDGDNSDDALRQVNSGFFDDAD
jgi:hypothetical protein